MGAGQGVRWVGGGGGLRAVEGTWQAVDDLAFTLHNRDQLVQWGSSDMLFSVDRLIAKCPRS